MDCQRRYDFGMADDVPKIIQEIMDADGITQTELANKIGVAQSTINRWLNSGTIPNIVDWERVRKAWLKAKGYKITLDEKVRPYGPRTEAAIHDMVDNYLSRLPPID